MTMGNKRRRLGNWQVVFHRQSDVGDSDACSFCSLRNFTEEILCLRLMMLEKLAASRRKSSVRSRPRSLAVKSPLAITSSGAALEWQKATYSQGDSRARPWIAAFVDVVRTSAAAVRYRNGNLLLSRKNTHETLALHIELRLWMRFSWRYDRCRAVFSSISVFCSRESSICSRSVRTTSNCG